MSKSLEAYLKDPDTEAKEAERIHSLDAEYVLVTVLADTKREESPLTPGRLVRNLAGANNAVEQWTKEDIVEKAKESIEYYDNWHVVAD